MTSLKRHYFTGLAVLASLIGSFSSQEIAAARTCSISEDQKIFIGPKGQKIYLDFGSHRGPSETQLIQTLLAHPEQIDSKIIDDVETMIERTKERFLVGLQERADTLEKYITNPNSQITWMGVELSQSGLNQRDSNGRDFTARAKYLKDVLLKKGATPELAQQMYLIAFGEPGRFVWSTLPEHVRESVHLVPLDDENLNRKQIDKGEWVSIFGETLQKEIPASQFNALDELVESYRKQGKIMDEETIQKLAGRYNEKTAFYVYSFLKTSMEYMQISQQRDLLHAETAIRQPGNGVISLGSNHKNGVIANLQSLCTSLQRQTMEHSDLKIAR